MAPRITRRDRLLLWATLPLFCAVFAAHLHETARTGLAQLPVFAKWNPGDYPQVGGFRLETDSRESGMRLGDRLLRVGGRDLRGQGYIGFDAIALSLTSPGRPVPLEIERDGAALTLPLEARPHAQPWSRVPILVLIPLVCVLLMLRAPGQPEVERFYLCFMTYAIGQAQFYGGPVWQTWIAAWVWNVCSVLMVGFMLHWVRHFPTEMPESRRVPAALPWLWAATYLVLVRLGYLLGWPLPSQWVPGVSFALHGITTVLGILVLTWNYYHAWTVGRRRLRWILLGTALGSLPVIAAGLAPLLAPGWEGFRQAFAIGFLSSAIWMMGALLGTVRDNAFDVDRLISNTAAWALAVASAVASIALVVPPLSAKLAHLLGLEPAMSRLALAAALGALVLPVGARLRPQMDRLLFPGRAALQESAERLLEQLARCPSTDLLLATAAERSAALFESDGFALYLNEPAGLVRRLARGLSVAAVVPRARAPRQIAPRNAPAELAPGVGIAAPISIGHEVDALICLGAKRSGDIYTSHDAGVLARIASRVEREWLRFLKSAADRESHEKSNLLAAVSHDLRQPLHAVSLLTEALAGRLTDPEVRALVGRIGESTHDLDEMLTSVLDRSRLDAGAVTPEVRDFALSEIFELLERDFAPQADARGIRLRIVPSALAVRSDRQLLARILRNLLSNALRYGGGTVLVGARARGEEVRVEVRDAGTGIPEKHRRRIFDAFRQLPGSAETGLGLGLSIVDSLVRLLGHQIELRSQPGRGSTFALRVPRARAAAPRVRAAAASEAAALPRVKHVLVLDDDARVRRATVELLRAWGCETREAGCARDALAALAEGWRPDFVVADYRLGDGELGPDVIDQLRAKLGEPMRGAILMAETTAEELEAIRARGIPALRKPVRPAKLRALLAAPRSY